ncbi:hypothetical protein Tco_1398467 [Tanacetum coccineum]
METKDTVSSCSVSKDQEIQRLQEKARLSKGGCMKGLKALQSNFKILSDDLKDIFIMENTCFGKENCNSATAFSKSVKESSLDSGTKDVHASTRIEHGFKRAFMPLFCQDDETFTSTMFLNVDQLQKQLDKDEFQEDGSMAAFWVLNRQL